MPDKRAETILIWMQLIETATLNRALDGLTQHEFIWMPHPGAWSIARREECQTPTPLGAAESQWVVDYDTEVENTNSAIEPMTTIAWLLNHFGAAPGLAAELEYLGGSIDPSWPTYRRMWQHTITPSADEAVATFLTGWSALGRALATVTDEMLEREIPADIFPWGRVDRFVSGVVNEVSHHGTQICMLRDLYRQQPVTA